MKKFKFSSIYNFFKEKSYILKFYYRYVKKGLFLIILFSIFGGFLESIGISMLFPIFQYLISNSEALKLPNIFNELFEILNINLSIRNFIVFFIILFIIKSLVKFLTGYLKVYFSGKFLLDLRKDLINLLVKYDYKKFLKNDTGKISSTLTMEVEKLLSGFMYFSNYLVTLFTGITFIIVIFSINYKFALIILLFGVIYYSSFKNTNKKIKYLSKEITSNNSKFNSLLIQFIHSFKYLKSTNNFNQINELINNLVTKIRNNHLQKDIKTNIIISIQEPATLIFLIFIVYIAIKVIKIDASISILIILLFYRSTTYFISSQTIWNNFLSQIGSTNSVIDFKNFLEINKEKIEGTQKINFSNLIEFNSVDFGYELTSNLTIKNLNVVFKNNKTTALVGRSGSGKSTIINLVTGLLKPNSGIIQIDNININKLDLNDWRSKIGYITQDSVIFNDTLLNNITLWKYDSIKDKDRLINAIKMSQLDDFILDDKLNSIVGDRGISLSGGQKQRIAIARELYREPSILILDEATSALDSETENNISKSIESLNGKMTIIVIAHRLSTIKKSDYIYVLEDGTSIEEGSYQELASNSASKFNSYLKLQSL